ncbi:ribonuclease D [Magnetofaba australis]
MDDLSEALETRYLASKTLAVDCETLGLVVPRDRLCLVQMCNEDGVACLVQIRNYRAPRLKRVLEAQSVEKLFHFARYDLATLRHWLGIYVAPVFCTKIASKLVRTYTDGHGLKDVVRELVGVELDKQQQSSDWAAETLTPEQVDYALSDVLYLVEVKTKLEAMLQRENRLELAKQTMAFLPTRVALDLAGWEEHDIFSHRSR